MSLPFAGPVKVYCPCGCGVYGTPKVRAWGDGLRHVKGCKPCKRCEGSRHSKNARRRENTIAFDLGGTREAMSGVLSGKDVTVGVWAFEETSNEAIVRGFRFWWNGKGVQTKLARLMRLPGARALVLSWDGRPQIVITPYDDFVGQFPYQTKEGGP